MPTYGLICGRLYGRLKLSSSDDEEDDNVIGVDGFDRSSNENGLLSPFEM